MTTRQLRRAAERAQRKADRKPASPQTTPPQTKRSVPSHYRNNKRLHPQPNPATRRPTIPASSVLVPVRLAPIPMPVWPPTAPTRISQRAPSRPKPAPSPLRITPFTAWPAKRTAPSNSSNPKIPKPSPPPNKRSWTNTNHPRRPNSSSFKTSRNRIGSLSVPNTCNTLA